MKVFDMVNWACAAKSTDFASLVPLVTEAADNNDKWGTFLMKKAAEEIDLISESIKKQSNVYDIKCYLIGGLAPFIYKFMEDKSFTLLPPPGINSPAMGALIMLTNQIPG